MFKTIYSGTFTNRKRVPRGIRSARQNSGHAVSSSPYGSSRVAERTWCCIRMTHCATLWEPSSARTCIGIIWGHFRPVYWTIEIEILKTLSRIFFFYPYCRLYSVCFAYSRLNVQYLIKIRINCRRVRGVCHLYLS